MTGLHWRLPLRRTVYFGSSNIWFPFTLFPFTSHTAPHAVQGHFSANSQFGVSADYSKIPSAMKQHESPLNTVSPNVCRAPVFYRLNL